MQNLKVQVENPLLRTPLALIVDDSCPVINLTYYWINQRQTWKAKFQPEVGFKASDGDPRQMHKVPSTIPSDFAQKWGDWCGEQGIKGKFSLVPYPAGVARIDQGFAARLRARGAVPGRQPLRRRPLQLAVHWR